MKLEDHRAEIVTQASLFVWIRCSACQTMWPCQAIRDYGEGK